MKGIGIAAVLAITLSACSWVDTQPGAERVVVIDKYQAESCQRVGRTETKTLNKLWLLEREEQKIREELLTLARNQANKIGGNALLPLSSPENGKQAFVVYKCNP